MSFLGTQNLNCTYSNVDVTNQLTISKPIQSVQATEAGNANEIGYFSTDNISADTPLTTATATGTNVATGAVGTFLYNLNVHLQAEGTAVLQTVSILLTLVDEGGATTTIKEITYTINSSIDLDTDYTFPISDAFYNNDATNELRFSVTATFTTAGVAMLESTYLNLVRIA